MRCQYYPFYLDTTIVPPLLRSLLLDLKKTRTNDQAAILLCRIYHLIKNENLKITIDDTLAQLIDTYESGSAQERQSMVKL